MPARNQHRGSYAYAKAAHDLSPRQGVPGACRPPEEASRRSGSKPGPCAELPSVRRKVQAPRRAWKAYAAHTAVPSVPCHEFRGRHWGGSGTFRIGPHNGLQVRRLVVPAPHTASWIHIHVVGEPPCLYVPIGETGNGRTGPRPMETGIRRRWPMWLGGNV